MNGRPILLGILSSTLALVACQSETNWTDLTSRELYAGWGNLTQEQAVARCDSVTNRKLARGETLYAVAAQSGRSDSMAISPLMVLTPEGFRFTDTQEIKFLTQLEVVDSGESVRIHPRPAFSRMGADHCYWSASAATRGDLPAILTSGTVRSFREPAPDDITLLARLRSTCTVQGDFPPGQEPPCTSVNLFAVSDLDGDGLDEFWFSVPYMWDIGFQVAELAPDRSDLVMIASNCLGCD